MPNLSTSIADSLVEHQIQVLRTLGNRSAQFHSMLDNLTSRVERLLLRSNNRTLFQRGRLQRMLNQINTWSSELGAAGVSIDEEDLGVVARTAHRATANSFNDVFGVDLVNATINPRVVKKLLEDPYGGQTLKTFWARQSQSMRTAYESIIREGVSLSEGKSAIVKRLINDPRIARTPKHSINTWVRTSTIGVSNSARDDLYNGNADLIKGIMWLSTLDSRTSNICKSLDGLSWTLDRKPIDHDRSYPGPVAHPNCRSTQVPILRSFEELAGKNKKLARKLDDAFDNQTRASMDGQVPKNKTYEEFLRDKGDDFAREVLGPTRFQLWKEGKIGVRDLIDQSGRPLLVSELRDSVIRAPGGFRMHADSCLI